MFFLYEKISNTFKIDYNRAIYENALRDPGSKIWRKLSAGIELLVVISVVIIIIESVGNYWEVYKLPFYIVDYLIATIFAVEYLYRFMRASKWFFKTLKNYKNEYKAMISLFAIVLIIVSTLVYYIESPVNPTFDSVPHSLWWGLVTMTAVWYWDMVPLTTGGRLLGSLLIFFWPVMLAVASAITILVFMDVAEWHRKFFEKNCSNCKQLNREDAKYCFNCGKQKFENITGAKSKVNKIISKKG